MSIRTFAAVAIALTLLCALAVWRPAGGAARADIIGNPQSRYVLTPAQGIVHRDLGGAPANSIIKMDNVTGETWVLHSTGWKAIKTVP